MPTGSMSFDWSDFPVVYQYNEDMPAPPVSSSSPGPAMQYSSTPVAFRTGRCSPLEVPPTLPWEIIDDEDSNSSSSVSSDEETLLASPPQEERPKKHTRERSIKFSDIMEVRSHAVVLGNHPCSSGLALELSWEPSDIEVVNFEVFENSRQSRRRHISQLRLSYYERRRLLEKSTGLSEYELVKQELLASRENDVVPRQQAAESNKDKAPTYPVKNKDCSLSEDSESAVVLKKVSSAEKLSTLLSRR